MTSEIVVGINLWILLANIGILGLNLKLYTEYFKNEAQRRRKND